MVDWKVIFESTLNYGPMGLFLAFICFCLYKTGKFLGPFIRDFFEANISLVRSLESTQRQLVENQMKLIEGSETQTEILKMMHDKLENHINENCAVESD